MKLDLRPIVARCLCGAAFETFNLLSIHWKKAKRRGWKACIAVNG